MFHIQLLFVAQFFLILLHAHGKTSEIGNYWHSKLNVQISTSPTHTLDKIATNCKITGRRVGKYQSRNYYGALNRIMNEITSCPILVTFISPKASIYALAKVALSWRISINESVLVGIIPNVRPTIIGGYVKEHIFHSCKLGSKCEIIQEKIIPVAGSIELGDLITSRHVFKKPGSYIIKMKITMMLYAMQEINHTIAQEINYTIASKVIVEQQSNLRFNLNFTALELQGFSIGIGVAISFLIFCLLALGIYCWAKRKGIVRLHDATGYYQSTTSTNSAPAAKRGSIYDEQAIVTFNNLNLPFMREIIEQSSASSENAGGKHCFIRVNSLVSDISNNV